MGRLCSDLGRNKNSLKAFHNKSVHKNNIDKKVEEAQKCVAALDVDQDGDFPKTYVMTWVCIERIVDVLM